MALLNTRMLIAHAASSTGGTYIQAIHFRSRRIGRGKSRKKLNASGGRKIRASSSVNCSVLKLQSMSPAGV
jgi:hypothetical protein